MPTTVGTAVFAAVVGAAVVGAAVVGAAVVGAAVVGATEPPAHAFKQDPKSPLALGSQIVD
jgi:hypothetical protein